MVNRDIIRKIKQSTVAIGLVEKDGSEPLEIHGSGFIIDENGVVATAFHVLKGCKDKKKFYKEYQNRDTNVAIFRIIPKESGMNIDTAMIGDFKNITNVEKSENFPLDKIDLGFGKMFKVIPECTPLEISSEKLDLPSDIAMCGFPAGEHTLDWYGKNIGLRFSPTIQFGKISGFLPFDDAPNPYGIQTDIIGVGGSSGSPIVDSNDGKVIAIAQQVLPADVEVNVSIFKLRKEHTKGYGIAKVGQVVGVSHNVLNPIFEGIKKFYRGEQVDKIKINASGLVFSAPESSKVFVKKSSLD